MKRLGSGAPVGGGGMEYQPGDSNGVYVFLSDGPMGDSQRRPLGKHGWQHEVQSRTGSSPSPRLDDDGLPPADPTSDNTDHRQAPSWRPTAGGSSRQLQHGSSRGGHRGGVPPPSLDVRPLSAGDVLAGSGGSTSGEAANRPQVDVLPQPRAGSGLAPPRHNRRVSRESPAAPLPWTPQHDHSTEDGMFTASEASSVAPAAGQQQQQGRRRAKAAGEGAAHTTTVASS